MSSQIIGISCVYGVTVSFYELLNIFGLDPDIDLPELKELISPGLSIFTHPEWTDDTILLGVVIVSLDMDPSICGSTIAPVITIPDAIDFSQYSNEMPRYFQIPIME